MKKRVLCMLLAVSMMLGMVLTVAPPVAAASVVQSDTCGESASYTLDSSGLLTVSGTGPVTGTFWNKTFTASIKQVVVEEGITALPEMCFRECVNMTSAQLPSTLTEIPRECFSWCESLKSITIPEGVTTVGPYAFGVCTGLTEVNLPSTLERIEESAFGTCNSVTELTVPASLKYVGEAAFANWDSLAQVHISDMDAWLRIEFQDVQANPMICATELYLNGAPVTQVVIPEGITKIQPAAFCNVKTLESVTIPQSVTEMGSHAFSGCVALKAIQLPQGLTSIPYCAFYNCALLEEVVIPDSVTAIGGSAFYGCDALRSLQWPASVESVGSSAFFDCFALEELHITDLDAWARTSLADFYSNPMWWGAALLLNGEPVTGYAFPEGTTTVNGSVFAGCKSLTQVYIPDSVTEIGEYAFVSCRSLAQVRLPQTLQIIGQSAFRDCYALELEGIPDCLTSIGQYAFSSVPLERVVIPQGVTKIEKGAFGWNPYLTEVEFHENVTSIGESAFYSTGLKKIVLPDNLQTIGTNAFGRLSVNSVWMPVTVTEIAQGAFQYTEPQYVYYYGTQDQWKAISIGADNEGLENATIFYSCDQWQDLVDMGFTLEQILTQPNLVIKPTNDQQLIFNVGQVTVSSAMGSQTVTDQCMIPLDVAVSQDIVLSAEGYRDYIIPTSVAATMVEGSEEKGYTPYTLNAFLQLDQKDGKPYISTVFIRETGSGAPYKDARVTEYYAAKGVCYDLVMTCVGMEGKDVTYYISQNEENRIESSTGVFTAQELTDMFVYGKKLYAYAKASDGTLCEPVELKLGMLVSNDYAYALLNSTTFSLFGDDGFKLKVADSYPILGGLELGMKGFTAPIGVDINGNQVRISIGLDLFSASKEDSNKTEIDGIWKSFKKEFQGIQGNSQDHEKALLRYRNLKQRYDDGLEWDKIMKNRGFDVEFMGYVEAEIVNGELIFKDALVSVTGTFSTSGTKYGSLWGVPVYLASGFDGSLTATGEWARLVADRNIPVDFGISLDVNPELWIEGGAGIRNVINIGVYGKGGAPYHVNFSEKYHKWKLTGEIGIRGRLLLWTMEKKLLSGEYVLLEEYYGSPADAVLALTGDSADTGSVTVSMADRSYLENDSGWLGGAADMTLFAESVSAADFRVLQTGVFTETKPQLAQAGGKLILTWIEDDPSRDDYNRMRLVYSVYDPLSDTWSEPRAVYDDGCNDANVTLAVCGDQLVIAWQKLNSVMTAEDFTTTDPLLRTAEAYVAIYDPATDTVTQVQRLTENETFDYLPIAACVSGQPAVYYLSCPDNDLTGSAGSLYLWTQEQESVELASGLGFVQTMDASGAQVAWITDGGLFTYSGAVVQVDTSALAQQPMGLVYGADGLYLTDAANVYAVSGGVAEALLEQNRIIGGNLVAVRTDVGNQLYWMETGDTGNELYRTTCVGGTWTEPVRISAQGMTVSCVDIECYNGELLGVCNLTDAEELTALAAFTVGDIANIALDDYFYFDETQALSGGQVAIDVTVTNLGTTDVTGIVFTLTDTLGTSHTLTEAVALPSGSTQTVTLTYPVPADFAPTTLTVTAAISGQEDADLSDNTVSMAAGECDLSIGLKSQESAGEKYLITATVSNDSGLTAQNVGVSVILEGQTARNITVGTLDGGERAVVEVSLDAFALDFGSDGVAEVQLRVTSDTALSYTGDDTLTVTLVRRDSDCDHPELTELSTTPPTCLAQGYTQYSCPACGRTVTDDYVDALGHDHSYSVTTAPTEEASGVLTAQCGRCADSFPVELPRLNGTDYTYSVITEPTYTEDGLARYTWKETAYGEIVIEVVLPDLTADIQEIQIIGYPVKTFYTLGEALDPVGLNLLVLREDGEKTVLAEGFTLSGFTSDTPGIKTVTLTYEGFTAEFTLAVVQTGDLYGKLGDMAFWLYQKATSTLTVFGLGATDDLPDYGDKPWETVRSSIAHIVVADGITALGDYTFGNLTKVLDVSLGNTLQFIGAGAFQYCSGLTSLTLPASLRAVSDRGFMGCTGLTEVHVRDLADWFAIGFENNFSNPCADGAQLYAAGEQVAELTVPEGVTAIGNYQLYGATWLTSLTVGPEVTQIGDYSFYGCTGLAELSFGENVEAIGQYAFHGCTALTELTLEGSLRVIGDYAFYKSTALETLTLGGNVVSLGKAAFGHTAITELVIPDSVTGIGPSAFVSCKNLRDIRFGTGLVTLGGFAFQECDALETVVLPDSLTELGEYAFSYCDNLTQVTFGQGLRHIRQYAFYYSDAAFDGLPLGLETVETYAFYGCQGAEALVIGPNVTKIGSYAFASNANLKKLSFLGSAVAVDEYAFQCCGNLEAVDMGSCAARFGENAFANCTGLTGVHVSSLDTWLSQSFASVEASPLFGAGELYIAGEPLRELVIPAYVQQLPMYAFAGCTGMTELTLPEGMTSISTYAFAHCENLTELTVPEGVEGIGMNAFRYCTGLKQVFLPDGLRTVGQYAFMGCWDMVYVSLPDSLTNVYLGAFRQCNVLCHVLYRGTQEQRQELSIYSSDNSDILNATWHYEAQGDEVTVLDSCSWVFCYCDICEKYIEVAFKGLGNHTYEDGSCTLCGAVEGLEYTVTEDATVTVTGYSGSAQILRIPETIEGFPVTAIEDKAFARKGKLVEVSIPDSVTSIGEDILMGCTALEKLTVPFLGPDVGMPLGWFFGETAFSGATATKQNSVTYYIPDSLRSVTVTGGQIVDYSFYHCANLEEIVLPEDLTAIGELAFCGCEALTQVQIPASVTRIGDYAFNGCSSLQRIAVPEGVTELGDGVFSYCPALETVELPQSLTSLGASVFEYCTGLKGIELPSGLTKMGPSAFYGCSALETVVIPDGVAGIPSMAFYECTALREVTLPRQATEISDRAFALCKSLERIEIPQGVTKIGFHAFSECSGLKEVLLPESLTTIEYLAFYKCGALTQVTIPGSVTSLGSSVFRSCTGLMMVVIEEGVTSIPNYCFDGCSKLACVVLPDSVTKVSGGNAFSNCVLRHVLYTGTQEQSAAITYEESSPDLKRPTWHYEAAGDEVHVTDSCAGTLLWCDLCEKYIILFQKQTPDHVFSDGSCTKCGAPEQWQYTLTEEGTAKVTGYTGTDRDVTVPSVLGGYPVTALGSRLFAYNTTLRSVVIPEGVTVAEYGTFYGCMSLQRVVLPQSLTRIPDNMFSGCLALTSVNIPRGVTEIGSNAFYGCESLDSVTLPDSLTSIGSYAFRGCTALKELSFPADAPVFGLYVFGDMTVTVYYPCDNATWTASKLQQYGGTVTWVAQHEYTSQVTPPGHLTDGFTTHTCGLCGHSYVDTPVSAEGHTEVTDPAVEPSCTATGLTEGKHCPVCGQILEAQEEVPALGHSWDEGVVTVEPTEESTGIRTHKCTRCGETEERQIPNLEHVHSYDSQIIHPSCTTIGFTVYTCRCGDSYKADYVSALGHTEVPEAGWEPTCTEPGMSDGSYCALCREILTEQTEIPALGHDPVKIPAQSATCTEPGLTEGQLCTRCDKILVEQQEIPPIEHTWDEGTVTLEPTEQTEGLRLYSCLGCGEKREELIPRLDHVHRYEPVRTEPTCTENGCVTQICSCSHSYVSQILPMLPHEPVEQGYRAPTCTEAGYTGDQVCAHCGQLQELGSKMEATGHAYQRVDTVPTCTEEGFSTHTCHCGESYTDEYIPALGHSFSGWILTGSGQIYRTCYACGSDEIMDALPTVDDPAQAIILAVDILEKHTYEIAMTEPVWGNVVCIVEPEGGYTVLPETQITPAGVRVTLPGSCRIIVVNKALSFPDVGAQNRFRTHVDYLTARSIMSGKLDGTYGLSENIQRRTVAMVLWRLAGSPQVEGKSPFPDVTGGRYLMPVLWAYQNGIISGYTDGTFRPTDNISRQHFAIMLYRYVQWTGVELERGENGKLEDFSDYADMNRRMYEAMQWALDCGLINGKGGGIYDPTGYTTRGQMTIILSRYLQKYYIAIEENT